MESPRRNPTKPYSGDRYGVIIAASGERLFFRRRSVIGDGGTWTPQVGQAVAFACLLNRRGLKAYKVRPLPCTVVIGSRPLAQAVACFAVEAPRGGANHPEPWPINATRERSETMSTAILSPDVLSPRRTRLP